MGIQSVLPGTSPWEQAFFYQKWQLMSKIRNRFFNKHNKFLEQRAVWDLLDQLLSQGRKPPIIGGAALLLVLVTLILLTQPDYARTLTGFNQNNLRDWLELLIAPLVLVVGTVLFYRMMNQGEQRAQHELKIAEWYAQQEREIAAQRLREAAFQTYLDRMTELLLEKGLRRSEGGDEVRDIARARTLAVLRGLDGEHKGILLRFLYETGLIQSSPIIELKRADLSGAHLKKADLEQTGLKGANLSGADMEEANLEQTDLSGAVLIVANLSGANLSQADISRANLTEALLATAHLNEANLHQADLHGANLEGAEMIGVNLTGADLRGAILIVTNLIEANLKGAILREANLEGADLIEANLQGVDLSRANLKGVTLRGAKYNRQTKWPQAFSLTGSGAVRVD